MWQPQNLTHGLCLWLSYFYSTVLTEGIYQPFRHGALCSMPSFYLVSNFSYYQHFNRIKLMCSLFPKLFYTLAFSLPSKTLFPLSRIKKSYIFIFSYSSPFATSCAVLFSPSLLFHATGLDMDNSPDFSLPSLSILYMLLPHQIS
jgi:hypothetical protein